MIENTKLQSALTSLQEKYAKLQLKTETLNAENERLVSGRSDLLAEISRLQEQQIKLRERNLQLTQEYHAKQKECSLLAEKVALLAREQNRTKITSAVPNDDSSSFSKYATIDPNLPSITRQLDTVRQSWWTAQMLGTGLTTNIDNKETDDKSESEKPVNSSPKVASSTDEDEEIIRYLKQCRHKALSLKTLLLSHKAMLRKLCEDVKSHPSPRHTSTTQTTETSIPLDDNGTKSEGVSEAKPLEEQICPLCEAQFFSGDEDFQNHVVEHFKIEKDILALF